MAARLTGHKRTKFNVMSTKIIVFKKIMIQILVTNKSSTDPALENTNFGVLHDY